MIADYKNHSPKIDKTAFVAKNATIIGKVELKENSSVWYGVVLRGDIEPIIIGKNSNIQDNSVCHTSPNLPVIVGENVTVGHNVTLHACKIGNNCLIGMNAVILDGVEIPDNVIVGAGSVVPPNKKLEPNSLYMGIPAKKVKELTKEDIEKVIKNAVHYIELSEEHKKI